MEPERDPRVYFAAERTFLAWVRTGLALMGFGFVVARFGLFLREMARIGTTASSGGVSLWAGTALVVLGAAVNLQAALAHIRYRKRFEAGNPMPERSGWGILVAGSMSVIGIVMAVYLISRS